MAETKSPPGGESDFNIQQSDDDDNGKRTMNWCFTWNNYTQEDINTVKEHWISLPDMRCIMFEPEIAPKTKTPHLQGFFIFHKIKSFKQVKAMISPKIRLSQMRKPIEANERYCSKDGKAILIGSLPMSQKEKGEHGIKGKGNGFEAISVWTRFKNDCEKGLSHKELMSKYPAIAVQYPNGFDRYVETFAPRVPFDIVKKHGSFYPWQQQLMDIIELGPDARSVIWIYSVAGNAGKSDMFKHLVCLPNSPFEPLMNATTRDLSCAWKCGSVLFDFARDNGGVPFNYAFMEMVKNGFVFSAKYASQTKKALNMTKQRWVICFSNERPDISKLSLDRWAIFEIMNDLKLHWRDPEL